MQFRESTMHFQPHRAVAVLPLCLWYTFHQPCSSNCASIVLFHKGFLLMGIGTKRPICSQGLAQPHASSLNSFEPCWIFQGSCSLILSFFFYSVLFWGALILEMRRQIGTNLQMPLMAQWIVSCADLCGQVAARGTRASSLPSPQGLLPVALSASWILWRNWVKMKEMASWDGQWFSRLCCDQLISSLAQLKVALETKGRAFSL